MHYIRILLFSFLLVVPQVDICGQDNQNNKLSYDLCVLLDKVETALTYWEKQKAAPYRYFLGKNPTTWFNGQWPQDEIAQTIELLQEKKQEYFSILGKLSHDVPVQDDGYMVAQEQELDLIMPPAHVQRYWARYVAGAAGLAALAYYANKHQSEIVDFSSNMVDGVNSLYEKHAKKPWQDFKELLMSPNSGMKRLKAREIPLDDAAIKKLLIPIIKQEFPLFSHEDVMVEAQRNLDGTSSFIEDVLVKYNQNPLWYSANILQILVAKAQLEIHRFKKLANELSADTAKVVNDSEERLFDTNRLNFVLFALVPTALVAGAGYLGVKKALSLFQARVKNFTVMQDVVIMVRKICNTYNFSDAGQFAYVDQGALVYHVYKLREQALQLLEGRTLTDFLQDCQELESPAFTGIQKLEVTRRMMDVYPFLKAH